MIPSLFKNFKEASGKDYEIWLKLRLMKDMTTFQTLRTWIGYNATCYHNLNALPHSLPYALPYIFCEICLREKMYGNACDNALKLW